MQVRFILRSPGTGHSLEILFNRLIEELGAGTSLEPSRLTLPHVSTGPRSVWQNMRFVSRQSPRLTHITGDVHYVALAAAPRQTVLTIPNCVLLNRTPAWSLRFAVFWLLWYYLPIKRAAVVTVISEKTRRELRRYIGSLADKAVVIPCHYDPAFAFSPKSFNTSCPTILHIGTAPHKNLSRLIEAIAGLPCRLVVVGKLTAAERTLLAAQQLDYTNRVDCSQEAVIALYEQCDLVSFVSLYEGFGLPVLEGQVVGRPVVTSLLSPMTEVGGEGACYVNPTSVADIRRGILRVWQNDDYRNELIAAGQRNAANYTIERVSAQYTALYASLAP